MRSVKPFLFNRLLSHRRLPEVSVLAACGVDTGVICVIFLAQQSKNSFNL
ncbi:MAG: hypothetical protein J6586_00425 [Snodgrassella sp.]|jgi:hypothetical protein|nr:hypothetical protein [Snodgrassella sp.]